MFDDEPIEMKEPKEDTVKTDSEYDEKTSLAESIESEIELLKNMIDVTGSSTQKEILTFVAGSLNRILMRWENRDVDFILNEVEMRVEKIKGV